MKTVLEFLQTHMDSDTKTVDSFKHLNVHTINQLVWSSNATVIEGRVHLLNRIGMNWKTFYCDVVTRHHLVVGE